MRALLANEPRAYRESLAATLEEMRPTIEVFATEPEQLDDEVQRLHPDLVVCAALSSAVMTNALTWILLYPDGERRIEFSIAGERSAANDIQLTDLLGIVDQTERLV